MKTLRQNKIKLLKQILLLASVMALSVSVFAQQAITITGNVLDEMEKPIPGATILVKGTTSGTISDIDGNFTLNCNTNETLIVSFVGYLSESYVAQEGQKLNIVLIEDIAKIGEVVVVGYGTMRKEDLTGSISTVSADELHQGVITTTEQALQGKISGLTVIKGSGDPTAGATMRIRGSTSLSASSSPLVVVDGIPGVDINSVHPSDIASVDVLKDASAAAIYGSRGANGVILITTTKANQGKKMEYSTYVAFAKPSNKLDLLSADDWRQKVEELETKGAIDWEGSTDWQDEITRNSVSQSHALSFGNSNENGGYRASLSYMDNEGVIKTSYLKRLGASLSGYTYGLNDKLKIDLGIHTNMDEYNPVNNGIFKQAYNVNPTAPVKDSTGNYFQAGDNESANPMDILYNVSNDNTRKRLLGYAKAELDIIEGLKYSVNVSYEYNSQQGRYYLPSYSRYGAGDNGYGNRSLNDYTNKQLETFLAYNKELAGAHRINVMAGYSYLDNTYEGFFAERRNFDTDMFLYNNLRAGLDYRANDVNSYKGNSKLISLFGRVNYSYAGKYSATATIRRDGSSRFGDNNKWGLFPSFAAAWKISDEAFMSSASSWLNFMKIRAGYGVTGSQDAIGEYKTIALLGVEGGKYYDPDAEAWKISYSPIQNDNPDLKWETTTQTNIGVDISFLNKFSVTIDAYKKLTKDLIFLYKVPADQFLHSDMLANVGEISNSGIEFALDWTILQTNDLKWNMNFTAAKNEMLIEKLSNERFQIDNVPSGSLHGIKGMSNEFSQTIREGYAVGTFWGQECTGLNEDGEFLNVNGDILKMRDDSLNTDLGNAQPKLTIGLNTAVLYKNFDFSMSTYGVFGQKVFNATAMELNDLNRYPLLNVPNSLFDDGITSDPTYSSYWIEDASFFRLQALTIGYSLKINNIGIDKLRVYVTGENLFVISKYSGLDPEIKIEDYDAQANKMSNLMNPGIDRFDVYPRPRTISIGLNVTF